MSENTNFASKKALFVEVCNFPIHIHKGFELMLITKQIVVRFLCIHKANASGKERPNTELVI